MKNKWLLSLAVFLGLAAGAGAYFAEQWLEANGIRFMRAGVQQWTQQINSSNQFVVTENNTLNADLLTIDDADGSVLLRSRTTTQLSTLAPTAAGELIVNSSIYSLCVSTGTGAGAWVMPRSTATATAFASVPYIVCY